MNYEAVTEIGLLAGMGFSFLAVLLYFALEIPALLREMRGLKGERAAKTSVEGSANAGERFPGTTETILLGGIEAAEPQDAGEKPGKEREWASFQLLKWEISVRSRREK